MHAGVVYNQLLVALYRRIGIRHGGKQALCIRMQRMAEQLLRFAQLHYAALVYNRYTVGYEANYAQIVSYEQIGQSAALLQIVEQIEHLRTDGNIQRAYRFVRNYELGLHYQRAGYAYALALTAAELMREAGRKLGQKANFLECLLNLILAVLLILIKMMVQYTFTDYIVYLGALVERSKRILEYHLAALYDLKVKLLGYFSVYLAALVEYFAGSGRVYPGYGAAYGGFAGTGFANQ